MSVLKRTLKPLLAGVLLFAASAAGLYAQQTADTAVENTASELPGSRQCALGDYAAAEGFYEAALDYFRAFESECALFAPLRVEALLRQARVLISMGRFDEAHACLQRCRQADAALTNLIDLTSVQADLERKNTTHARAELDRLLPRLTDTRERAFWRQLNMAECAERHAWPEALKCATEQMQDSAVSLAMRSQAQLRAVFFLVRLNRFSEAEVLLEKCTPLGALQHCDVLLLEAYLAAIRDNAPRGAQIYAQLRTDAAFARTPLAPYILSELARIALDQQQPQLAVTYLTDLFNLSTNADVRRKVLLALLEAYDKEHDTKGIIQTLEHYVALYPNEPGTFERHVRLAECYYDQGRAEASFATFEKLLQTENVLWADKQDLMRLYIAYLIDAGRDTAAIEKLSVLREKAESASVRGEANYLLAEAYLRQQRVDSALNLLRETIDENNPWTLRATYLKMMTLIELGDHADRPDSFYAEARRDVQRLRQTIGFGPIADDAAFFDAYLQAKAGDLHEALRSYTLFQSQHPRHKRAAEALLSAGKIALEREDFSQAYALLDSVLHDYPASPDVAQALSGTLYALYFLGHPDSAVQRIDTLVERYPESVYAADALRFLADSHVNGNNTQAALNVLDRLLALPNLSTSMRYTALYDKAVVLRRSGLLLDALSETNFYDAPNLPPQVRQDVIFLRAEIQAERKNYADAAELYAQAAAVLPQSSTAAVATARRGDALFAQYASDDDINDDLLMAAYACYRAVLQAHTLSQTGFEQCSWKLGHIHHLLHENDSALRFFIRPILDAHSAQSPAEAVVWVEKCAQSALEILQRSGTADDVQQAVSICNIMARYDTQNSRYWLDYVHRLNAEHTLLPENLAGNAALRERYGQRSPARERIGHFLPAPDSALKLPKGNHETQN